MSNPFEKFTENQKEENVEQKDRFDSIKVAIEQKTGKKLPNNKEELFRNFDELIPKEIDHINFKEHSYAGAKINPDGSLDLSKAAGFSYPKEISRKEMRDEIERELYGTTKDEIIKFFEDEQGKIENNLDKEQRSVDLGYKKQFDNKLIKKHDKTTESLNQLIYGGLEIPLADIELRIYDIYTGEQEKENLRKFAERLSAEIYKSKPKSEMVNVSDIKKHIEKEAIYFSSAEDDEEKNYNEEHFNKVLESLDNGDLMLARKEIEFAIGWIQEQMKNRKEKDLKNIVEKELKKRYGEDFMPIINKELEHLRSYRNFLSVGEVKKE